MPAGQFDLELGSGTEGPKLVSFSALLDAVDATFALPALSSLETIEAEGLTLTLQDARAKRVWQVGDGRLTLENQPDAVAMELGFSLVSAGQDPARAVLTFVTQKESFCGPCPRNGEQVAARDIAAQAPPLAWLGGAGCAYFRQAYDRDR